MPRLATFLPLLGLLAACATDPVEEPTPPLPMPPPAPPRAPVLRPAARPAPGAAEAAAVAALSEPARNPAEEVAAQPAPRLAWHVARDGVVGCADPAILAVLSQPAERTPRMLAEARASGGCRTTFRINEWVMETAEAETVRLRLTNGTPLTLWFRRGDVVSP